MQFHCNISHLLPTLDRLDLKLASLKLLKMVNASLKSFYNTALSQAFSPCGGYLAVGDIYGVISVFHVSKVTQTDGNLNKDDLVAKQKVTVEEDLQVNSLLTVNAMLLAGGVGSIFAYPWKGLKTSYKNKSPSWVITIPNQKDVFEKSDVNCLVYTEDNGHLLAACGDNNIYEFNLETRALLRTYSCHTDYPHCLTVQNSDLISGGEDGVINITDLRSGKVSNKFQPYKIQELSRPELGIWIGAVSASEDYILCGGGPRLSLWHSRFLMNSTVFPIDDKGIHVAQIYKDKILAGGRSKFFYQMSFLGDIITELPTSSVTVYSMAQREEPTKILSLAGSSSKVDICNNFLYKNQVLYL